ncbi:hypothetical protein [Nonomuraea sp. NPDC050643]|uniref:hypothetical protein n=1 Tax=Nonomuraea sp. NPDC050643 TaxID=3155660 RepID=UPI0033BFE3B2
MMILALLYGAAAVPLHALAVGRPREVARSATNLPEPAAPVPARAVAAAGERAAGRR